MVGGGIMGEWSLIIRGLISNRAFCLLFTRVSAQSQRCRNNATKIMVIKDIMVLSDEKGSKNIKRPVQQESHHIYPGVLSGF
jgi:hypothetical protein